VVKVREGAEVIGKPFMSGFFNHGLYRVVAIKRGQETIIPSGPDEIKADDMVYAVCTHENMKALREQLGKQKKEIRSVVFFGGSKIAQKAVQNMSDDLSIKILEADRELCYHLSEKVSNALIINKYFFILYFYAGYILLPLDIRQFRARLCCVCIPLSAN
jgi:trk system potassium uptake protein TrkA